MHDMAFYAQLTMTLLVLVGFLAIAGLVGSEPAEAELERHNMQACERVHRLEGGRTHAHERRFELVERVRAARGSERLELDERIRSTDAAIAATEAALEEARDACGR